MHEFIGSSLKDTIMKTEKPRLCIIPPILDRNQRISIKFLSFNLDFCSDIMEIHVVFKTGIKHHYGNLCHF